jgi:AraC-like DNA-binding protein
VQLVWSPDGDVELTVDRRSRLVRSALIPSHTEHALDAAGRTIALLLVESHGARGAELDRLARTEPTLDLSNAPFLEEASVASANQIVQRLVAGPTPRPMSTAARRAVAYVEAHLDGTPRLTDAAELAAISPTRLTHIFTDEVGVPFRRFVLWSRIKRAVEETARGSDLTRAAHQAGFSDAAHLSRTFRDMFGMRPSDIVTAETFKP